MYVCAFGAGKNFRIVCIKCLTAATTPHLLPLAIFVIILRFYFISNIFFVVFAFVFVRIETNFLAHETI